MIFLIFSDWNSWSSTVVSTRSALSTSSWSTSFTGQDLMISMYWPNLCCSFSFSRRAVAIPAIQTRTTFLGFCFWFNPFLSRAAPKCMAKKPISDSFALSLCFFSMTSPATTASSKANGYKFLMLSRNSFLMFISKRSLWSAALKCMASPLIS